MKNILEQLYNGEIYPAEQYRPKEKVCQKSNQEDGSRYDEFIEILKKQNPPLDKLFDEVMGEQIDEIQDEYSGIFISGFRLGARIMAEVFK